MSGTLSTRFADIRLFDFSAVTSNGFDNDYGIQCFIFSLFVRHLFVDLSKYSSFSVYK